MCGESNVKYVCTGSCGGCVSEEEFNAGKNTCAAPDCDKHGQPLEKKEESSGGGGCCS